MLFDLRGHRRRAVQATYLVLAVLMGGGLVLFGIGSSAPQGLVDAITGNSTGGGNVNEQLQKRIDNQKERLQASPANAVILADLVRLNYQSAVSQQTSGSAAFPDDAKDELQAAAGYWDRYVEAKDGDPSPDLARLAYSIFGQTGLNDPKKAEVAVRAIAAQANDFQSYLLLVQTATAAKDTRTAKLAAQKAVDLAPKAQKKQVQKAADQMQKLGASAQPDASTSP
jgi:hypothetical protein